MQKENYQFITEKSLEYCHFVTHKCSCMTTFPSYELISPVQVWSYNLYRDYVEIFLLNFIGHTNIHIKFNIIHFVRINP